MIDFILENILGSLWSNRIITYNFDMLHHCISFELEATDGKQLDLSIEEITMFQFYNGVGDERLQILSGNEESYLELTEINLLQPSEKVQFHSKRSDNWLNQFYAFANIEIGIWNSYLFIEAKKIILDGKQYFL